MKKNIPNILTCCRILFIPFLIYLGIHEYMYLLVVMVAVIAITDFFDGYLARKWNAMTPLGAKLDTIADKLFSITLTVILMLNNKWFIYLFIFEIIIAILNLFVFFTKGIVESLLVGKIKTWFIFITIISGFISYAFNILNHLTGFLVGVTLMLQVVSFVAYLLNYMSMKDQKKN